MKIALLSPPGLSPFSPPLGLMTLTSYLREEDIEVLPIDTSIEAIHYMLSPQKVKEKFLSTKLVLKNKELNLNNNLRDYFDKLKDQAPVIERIVQGIWNEEGFCFTEDSFIKEIKAVNKALIFSSVNYLPTIYSLNRIFSSKDIIFNKSINPYYEYFLNKLIPVLEEFQPNLIGISFSYSDQINFGMFLISEIKRRFKNIPTVVGGSFFSILCSDFYGDKLTSFNSIKQEEVLKLLQPFGIIGEGEEPLLKLCKYIDNKESLENMPGLVYYDKKNNYTKVNSISKPISQNFPPIVSMDGFSTSKYLTPYPVAPMMSSRGCYWNKCTFCTHAEVVGSNWRELPVEKVLQNLKLFKENGIEMVVFCDESMSPSMLLSLSKKIIDEDIKINFGTMIRFEESLLDVIEIAAMAGCKYLSFGLESGCSRIVSLMKKGYSHETAQCIIDKCDKNGISVELHIMFGFPSETHQESQQTIKFLEKNIDAIFCFRANPWILSVGSELHKNMNDYGIIPDEFGFIPSNPNTYSVKKGISYKETLEIIYSLYHNKLIGQKLIYYGFDGFSEEYYAIIDLIKREKL